MTDWKAQVRRMAHARIAADPARLAALWAEAEAEAWQEVRAVLKAALVEALLAEMGTEGRRGGGVEASGGVGERERRGGGAEASGGVGEGGGEPASLVLGPSSVVSRQSSVDAVQGSAVGGQPFIVHRPPPTGIYVYAIIDCTDLKELPKVGVAEGCLVTLQVHGDLAAVVSEVSLAEFGEEALHANLGRLEWLEARVRAHQDVLDALLPVAAVLPMKFATIYLDPSGVEELLATRYAEMASLLGHLAGRQEWGLKVYCDEGQLAAHIAEASPEIARLRAEIAGKPKGAAYLLARKLQEAEAEETERLSLTVADQVHTTLAELSVAACINPVQERQVTGRDEVMLLNAAYLVDGVRLAEFQSALADVSAEHSGLGFQCELSGPWPAYNFVSLSEQA